MFQTKFGKFISSLRNEKNLTQDELAEKLHVSSGKIVSKWENGNTLPDFEMIIQLSKELDISLYELSVCEKVTNKYITKEDVLKIINKKQLKALTLKKKLKYVAIFIISIISLISFIFTINNFNRNQVYMLESGTNEFRVYGSYTKTKDYSVFALTDVKYIGSNKTFEDIQVIDYDYELSLNDIKIFHSNQYKSTTETQTNLMYHILPKINVLIDNTTHNTKLITSNDNLSLIVNYKNNENKNFKLKIPIKLIKKSKNNNFW